MSKTTSTLAPTLATDDAVNAPNEIERIFVTARTVRQFSDREVSDEVLARAYENARWAPTASNSQPMRMLIVRSADAREQLASHMSGNNSANTLAAPVSVVIAADQNFHLNFDRLAPHMPDAIAKWEGMPEVRDTAAAASTWLQLGYLILALRAEGLDVGPMTGFSAAGIDQEFFADSSWKTLAALNLGYAAPDQKVYPRAARLDFSEVARVV